MSYRDIVTVCHLPPQRRVSCEDLDLDIFVVESCQLGRVTIINIVEMNTVSALTSLCIGRRPFRGFLKVAVQVLLTICLDVKVNDNMVLRNLDVVDLVSIDVLQSSANVRPSELWSSRRPCLLSRALHELLVEKGFFLIEVEGVRFFRLWLKFRSIDEICSESGVQASIPVSPLLNSLLEVIEVVS